MRSTTGTGRTVSEVSALTGVTVRTLHHYDDIGLLQPAHRSPAGYRRYTDADLARLHEILVWRALDFSLDEVGRMLDDPEHDHVTALRGQREQLTRTRDRLDATIAAIDDAIAQRETARRPEEHAMTDDDIRRIFAGDTDLFDPDEYGAEAEQRWGDTDAWRQSRERTAALGVGDWERIKREGDALNARFVTLLERGVPADAPEARAAAEDHRASIGRFYDCPPAMHRGLADLYVDDPRFTAYYERRAEGLARYVRDAIHANADRSGAS